MAKNEGISSFDYEKIQASDKIKVEIVPEKKGLFIKHVEYLISSQRYGTEVNRRYNDFVTFHEFLLIRFPYRLIPKLPPKKIVGVFPGDASFLENRRKSLERWLKLVSCHPTISKDDVVEAFLSSRIVDYHSTVKDSFKTAPDEFMSSDLASLAKELSPPNNNNDFAASREQIRLIHFGVQKIKMIADQIAARSLKYITDMEDLGNVLNDISSSHQSTNHNWNDIKNGLKTISSEFQTIKSKKRSMREDEEICERLAVLLEVLSGHQDLCERVEKGVSHDHQSALSKMMALKKRQIQGVLRGSDAGSIAALENRMLEQESVIASVESRTAFSLYCVRMETELVHSYLETLVSILKSLVFLEVCSHLDLAEFWKSIQSTVEQCLPKKNQSV